MNVSDFNYELPVELIAQAPSAKRDGCRLMVMNRKDKSIEHKVFSDILDYLVPGDCLVFNDSKVIPARLFGEKEETGAQVEFLLSKRLDGDEWETLVKPGKRLKPGHIVSFGNGKLRAEILRMGEEGTRIVKFMYDGVFMEILEELGAMPLPPYITRKAEAGDKDRYQNVYAKYEGSVACPTAGLHWTKELIDAAKAKGVDIAYVTLHVGIGTFRPVSVDKVEDHHMHFEEYSVSPENAEIINKAKARGSRIISVGTTACRTLESATDENSVLKSGSGSTGIFIYPGYKFKMVDCLTTNFHLPQSTLLMLISALYDRKEIMKAYEEAVKERYMFFSYGDACLII
ncbi:MAG: tRNA preQ1(34) S-adenosylmethionine ribosyltransferase-isomerase QueA [Clostridia bacterium]|nr:tRNA preQ1(34) S-adenosylmethionine ribosyltransferase-isomerase QueA [Clostridia bacterium]